MEEDFAELSNRLLLLFKPYKRMRCPVCKERESLSVQFRRGNRNKFRKVSPLVVTMVCRNCSSYQESEIITDRAGADGVLVKLYGGLKSLGTFASELDRVRKLPCPICKEKKLTGRLGKKRTVGIEVTYLHCGWSRHTAEVGLVCSSCGASGKAVSVRPYDALVEAREDFQRFPEKVAHRLMGKKDEADSTSSG